MADKSNNLTDVLIQAKLNLDEALSSVAGELNAAQLKRLRALEDTNTSCTNTGCGKSLREQVARNE